MNLDNYYYFFKEALTPRFCDEIIKYGKSQQEQIALTGGQTEKVNKGKFKGVTGVSFSKIRNKYVSAITINGIKKHLGYFQTQEQAGIAYQNELINNNNIK